MKGGDVSDSGRIYCNGYKEDGSRCLDHEIIMMARGEIKPEITIFNYKDSKEVQKLIREGKLVQYAPLEDK
jgi:nitric oxide synthase oxygenase domain/subunit